MELQRITHQGLRHYGDVVRLTRKTLPVYEDQWSDEHQEIRSLPTGEETPNPSYEQAVANMEAAQLHYDTTRRIEEKAAALGYRRNSYAGQCQVTGQPVAAGTGFVRKEEGRWVTRTWESVVSELGIKIAGLPAITE